MNRFFTACAISSALISTATIAAAPGSASLTEQYANYNGKGFVTVTGESGAYKSLVTRVDVVDLPVTWTPAWSGDAATSWQVLIDGEVLASGDGVGGSTTVPIHSGGLKEIVVRLCNDDGCSDSAPDTAVISDTDGSHLKPLTPYVDSANVNYAQSQDQIVGTYFVEWGIYGRKYFVENIPANNLTHIIYGFIPMCGENKSLKDGNAQGWSVLQADCSESEDYELVIHDMGAALWRQNGTAKAMKIDGTAVGYGEIGMGNFGHLMALKQGNPHLKILPSIGGWTLSDPFFAFTDKAKRDVFVASSKEFLKTWKFFDGIDIDWEFPGGGGANTALGDPINDGPAYIALMQELRAMLDELSAETGREYELTSAIGVGWDKLQDVDYAAAAQYMDNIFMMSYDFYGAWGSETGHQTGLYCGAHVEADKCAGTGEFGPTTQTDKTAEDYAPAGRPEYNIANGTRLLIEQGVPAEKLVVGAAMYGRGWTDVEMVDGSPIGAVGNHVNDSLNNPLVAEGGEATAVDQAAWAWEAGIMDYRGALKFLEVNQNAKFVWDNQAEASFIWDDVTSTLITLDTPQSIASKGVFLQEQGLGGIFSWEIDGDGGDSSENLLNAMNKAVGNVEGITNWEGEVSNTKPSVTLDTTATVDAGETLSIVASASDADGDALTYSWAIDSALLPSSTNTSNITIVGTDVSVDTDYTLILTVSDGQSTTTRSIKVTVVAEEVVEENNAPVLNAIADVVIAELTSTSLNAIASDADADELTFTWSVPSGLTLSGSGSAVTISATDVSADTSYTVSVTVSDGQETASQSFSVTVTDQTVDPVNTAPVITENADITIDELSSTSVTVIATDAENDTLTYTWSVPAGLTVSGSGSNVSITASDVSQDTNYSVSVSVSDGQASSSTSFVISVINEEVTVEPTGSWNPETIYLGGEVVTYNGKSYTAKWWTQNNVPTDGGPWGENFEDDGSTAGWSESRIYNGGDQVSFNGETYQAQWWTQGNMPGTNDVWVKL